MLKIADPLVEKFDDVSRQKKATWIINARSLDTSVPPSSKCPKMLESIRELSSFNFQ